MATLRNDRRELLKLGSLGLLASASAAPAYAFAPKPGAASPMIFDVRTYGATGDGKTIDTPAINKAIEAAAAAGGGTVYFPAGTYVCFSIHLKSHVDLFLAQGSTILAADSPLPNQTTGYMGGTYDAAEPKTTYDAFQDYGHNHWHNSLLWGEDIHDLSITGPGLIYGKGLSFGADRAPRGNYPRYTAEQPGVGNKAIALKNCRNVLFRDFSILKAGHFGLLLTGVDNLTIDNLKIDTDRDGMDIDCCKNVRVSNCTVNSPWDDAICPKSSFALGYNRSTDNLTITNCQVTGYYQLGTVLDGTFKKFAPGTPSTALNGRIKLGTESNGGFRNITISNCIFEGCMGLAIESEDGALVEDITISNITQRDLVSSPLFFRLGSRVSAARAAPAIKAPSSAPCSASWSTTSSATTPNPSSAPSSPASPTTTSRTSSSPTSTSSTRAETTPTSSKPSHRKTSTSTPTRLCSAPCPPAASSSVTSATSNSVMSKSPPSTPTRAHHSISRTSRAPTSSPSPLPPPLTPSPSTRSPTFASPSAAPPKTPSSPPPTIRTFSRQSPPFNP